VCGLVGLSQICVTVGLQLPCLLLGGSGGWWGGETTTTVRVDDRIWLRAGTRSGQLKARHRVRVTTLGCSLHHDGDSRDHDVLSRGGDSDSDLVAHPSYVAGRRTKST
jgi:hypothetical protein